jgi:DNA mismatch endonuclease (patch repair protein)
MPPDAWTTTVKGRHLGGRKKRDTKPEVLLRSAVHHLGLRYSVQKRLAPGCIPDFVLVRHGLAVFVDGDFWHQCPRHGRFDFTGPNAELWRTKMIRNRERDRNADTLAEGLGYRVLRIWECEVIGDPAAAALRVAAAVAI